MATKNSKILKIEKLKDKKFLCTNDFYSFIGEGDSVEKAIQSYERQQKVYLSKIKKFDLKGSITPTDVSFQNSNLNLSTRINWKNEIILHFIKSTLTILIVVLILGYMFSELSKSLESSIDEMTAKIETEAVNLRQMIEFQADSLLKGRDTDISFGDKLEKEINRGAESEDIDPERKARIIKSLEITAERYKPYVDAIKKLFSD